VSRRAVDATIAPVPRVALTRAEAAAAIGVSLTTFETQVQPALRLVRLGRVRLVPVEELQRWARETAERTL
jgi:hypothetical protein